VSVATFIRDLAQRGVVLSADGDTLRLRAPKGVLSDDDRSRLRTEKEAILASLISSDGNDDSFPLTDIQQAYLIGRTAELELGRVGCHAYREFESRDLDLPRLEEAWNRVVTRHPMLRSVMTETGRQRVLDSVPRYRIAERDLSSAADAGTELARMRAERSHRVFDPTTWPLFEIQATRLSDRINVSVGIDLLVADAAALITVFRDWGTLYAAPDTDLSPLRAQFRDYVRRLPPPSAEDRAYWEARLDELPAGPDLPRLPLTEAPRFSRRSVSLPADRWRPLKRAAAERGLTA